MTNDNLREEISRRYSSEDPRILDYILRVNEEMIDKDKVVGSYNLIMYDILVTHLKYYFKHKDFVDNNIDSDDPVVQKKSLKRLTNIQSESSMIMKILDKMTVSTTEAMRLKKLSRTIPRNKAEEAQELLDKLNL